MIGAPRAGDVLGPYTLREMLGEGGFAWVFLATGPGGSTVALKVLKPDRDGSYPRDVVGRFRRESRVLAELRSPFSVRLLDHGESPDGLLFLAFEYVAGRDLRAVLGAAGTLEPSDVQHILEQVLVALQELHNHGVVHRDIKPENIRVFQADGDSLRVKLLDFGIARDTATNRTRLTATGDLVGTPRYMSPEQLTSAPITPASDIYSLGLVGFELLHGRDSLAGASVGDQIDRLRADLLFPEVEASDLHRVLQRMTARDPVQRFPSASAVLRALQAGPPVTPPARPAPPHRPGLGAPIGIALALLAVLLAVVALVVTSQEAPEPTVQRRAVAAHEQLNAATDAPGRPSRSVEAPCGDDPGRGRRTLHIRDGLEVRELLVFVPNSYAPTVKSPLIALLHQSLEGPEDFLRYSGFEAIAEENAAVIVAPNGGQPAAWQGFGDVEIARSAIEDVVGRLCIDRDRVFAVGHAAGGRIAELLACQYPDLVRGIATTTYRGTAAERDAIRAACQHGTTTAHLHIAPLLDLHAPTAGGTPPCAGASDKISLEEKEAFWHELHACHDPAQLWWREADHECRAWTCESSFVSCRMQAGREWKDHTPRPLIGAVNAHCFGPAADIAYAPLVWRFFTAQQSP